MIGEVDINKQGGIDIQGIINQYQVEAGENISAGDFVEKLNKADWNNRTLGSNTINNSLHYSLKAIATDENKAIIFNTNGSSKSLSGIVCTISGTSITYGSTVTLASFSDLYETYDATLIDKNKIFLVYNSGASSDYYLYGKVITISSSGNTLSQGSQKTISSANKYVSQYIRVTSPQKNKAFITHQKDRYNGGCIVCTISGTSITYGADTQSSSGILYDYTFPTGIDTDKVFIKSRGNAVVCTISGTSITFGSVYTNITSSYIEFDNAVKLEPNKILITSYENYSNQAFLSGIVCTISGTTITAGTSEILSWSVGSYYYNSPVLIGENKVFIAFENRDASLNTASGRIYTISGTTITAETNEFDLSANKNSGDYISATLASFDKVFVVHRYGGTNTSEQVKMAGIVLQATSSHPIKKITASSQLICGVAQENGSGGNTINVIEPYAS